MPALNFKKQFAEKVETGEKRQTVRAKRKRAFVVGDKLYLYTGMRTKYCRKLAVDLRTWQAKKMWLHGLEEMNLRLL